MLWRGWKSQLNVEFMCLHSSDLFGVKKKLNSFSSSWGGWGIFQPPFPNPLYAADAVGFILAQGPVEGAVGV